MSSRIPADVLTLLGALIRYEEDHGPHEEWTCFKVLLDKVDPAVRLEAATWFAVVEKYRKEPPVEGWLPSDPPEGYPDGERFEWFRHPGPDGGIMGIPKGVVFRGAGS